MAHTKKLIVLLLTVFLSACLQTDKIPQNDLETLYGFESNAHQWRFTVLSTGCTQSSDFKLHTRVVGDIREIALQRIDSDLCRMAPHLIFLEWAAKPDGRNVRLLNPVEERPMPVSGIKSEK